MRLICSILLVNCLIASAIAQRTTSGRVVDQKELPIPNVKIQESSSQNIAYTDDNGEFTLHYFAQESKITFSHTGYDTFRRTLPYNENTLVFLTAQIDNNPYHLGYSVGYLDFTNKNKNKNLQNMPYFLGESDINRQLQMLPGIEAGTEGYSNLYVRGGDVDQNLMLYNGSPIYNYNHIFGISSIFHNRSINNTKVHRGIAPAKYGGRSSSVISLESKKTGDYSGLNGEFEMTPLNAGLYLESIKKGKGYFTVAARRSWIDFLLPVESRQNNFNANIYDIQVNFGSVLKNKDKLDFSILNTRDLYFFAFQIEDSTTIADPVTYGFTQKWGNLVSSVKYTQHISSKTQAEHSIHYSGYRSTQALKQETFDLNTFTVPTVERTLTRGVRDIGLHSNWTHSLSNTHTINAGFQSQTRLILIGKDEYQSYDFAGQDDVNRITGNQKYDFTQEVTLYGEDKVRLNNDITLDLGLRSTYYTYQDFNKVVLEPRLHATVLLKNRDVFKAGYNRHNQFVNQLSVGATGGPGNLWVPATELVLPQKVNMLEAGYEKKLKTDYSVSINAYLKTMANLTQVIDLTDASDADKDWQSAVTQGTGRSYGAEVLLQKSDGPFTGWISYAYSKSTRNFEDLSDEDFLFTYDRPHMLKLYVNYTRDRSDWNFGLNYVVGSGQLFTLPIGKYRDINGQLQLEYDELNNYRSPIYQRVDISIVKLKKYYGLGQEWRFYVYNALGGRNPLFVNADFTDNSYTQLQVNRNYLAFVPGIAYIVKF
jgi:hypothetical protein